ncbi:MAG: hypothetical protein ACQEWS_08180 [Bacillota bacterium]
MLNNVNPNWKLSVGQRVLNLYGEVGTVVEVHNNGQYSVEDDDYNLLEIYDRDELAVVGLN